MPGRRCTPATQLIGMRPGLTGRSDQVLTGSDGPRSRARYVYIGFAAVEVVGLTAAGILLLTA